jgi:hypothetical protein
MQPWHLADDLRATLCAVCAASHAPPPGGDALAATRWRRQSFAFRCCVSVDGVRLHERKGAWACVQVRAKRAELEERLRARQWQHQDEVSGNGPSGNGTSGNGPKWERAKQRQHEDAVTSARHCGICRAMCHAGCRVTCDIMCLRSVYAVASSCATWWWAVHTTAAGGRLRGCIMVPR